MSDAPERIWLTTTESGKVDDFTQWLSDQGHLPSQAPRTEYVRSDIHRSLALDLLAASGQAADAYAAQLKAEAMAEKLAAALQQYKKRATRVPFDLAVSADATLAEYEASK